MATVDERCSEQVFGGEQYESGTLLVAWNDTTLRKHRFTSSGPLKDFWTLKKGSLAVVISSFSKQQRADGMSFWTELFVTTSNGSGWLSDIYLDVCEPDRFLSSCG
jgi:hypothetical protein